MNAKLPNADVATVTVLNYKATAAEAVGVLYDAGLPTDKMELVTHDFSQ